ncbi:ProQ/FINO family protein [Burkholderia sp. WAC0059]|uniref:ProQ/FINO family protein n=1 Tax=Burkholderia sp. WAC0059 TaxID=2066022 RepID=UPI0011AFBF10|nr:ProQ/FINO family protein [Burkholderia sp. WAC0059]
MNAASRQRRTLSFKEGLLEIKKSMGGASPEPQSGQASGTAGEKRPPARGNPPPRGAKPNRGRPQQPQAKRPSAKPQQPSQPRPQPGAQGGRPDANARRHRPNNRPQAENLSEADKARIERNRQLNTVWNLFAKHYPAFRERLPLKIGVLDDLRERHPDYDRTLIVAVLKRHVNHPRYHEHVAAGGSRYELDGSVSTGPGIEPSHIGRAKAALERQQAKAQARAEQPAQAQQNPASAQPEAAAEKQVDAPSGEPAAVEEQQKTDAPAA